MSLVETRWSPPVVPQVTHGEDTRLRVAELEAMREHARSGGSSAATERQRAKGKLTVRERIDLLFDEGTFTEIEPFRTHRAHGLGLEERRPHTDGVVTGWGMIHGVKVFTYAHDARIFGGSLGEAHAAKIHKVMDLAISTGAPLVALSDGAGARIQEGVTALAGYGGIFRRNCAASGVIPQISVILGPCAGGAAYSPALTDAVFMVREVGQMFITGPDVVQAVTGESVSMEDLGGADVHGRRSGVATFVYDSEEACLEDVRYLVAILPPNNASAPPVWSTSDPATRRCDRLLDIVPSAGREVYDVRDVIAEIVDEGEFFEFHAGWAPNVVVGLARLGGRSVGVVASQPSVNAGALDIDASAKAAGFVQFCDSFNVPLLTLVDVPGFLPGREQEHQGIIRHGAKLLYAYCTATVPRVQLIMRKAYGGAYIVCDSLSIGADLSFAWPINEIAVMGAEGAANVVFRREIARSSDPVSTFEQYVDEYRRQLMHPYYAAERGLVHDVIDPVQTRRTLIDAFETLENKKPEVPLRKHGNLPI